MLSLNIYFFIACLKVSQDMLEFLSRQVWTILVFIILAALGLKFPAFQNFRLLLVLMTHALLTFRILY